MKMFWIYITGYCGLLTSPYLLGAGRRIGQCKTQTADCTLQTADQG